MGAGIARTEQDLARLRILTWRRSLRVGQHFRARLNGRARPIPSNHFLTLGIGQSMPLRSLGAARKIARCRRSSIRAGKVRTFSDSRFSITPVQAPDSSCNG